MRSTKKCSFLFILILSSTLHFVASFISKQGSFTIASFDIHGFESALVHHLKTHQSWGDETAEEEVDARIDLIPLQKGTYPNPLGL